MSEGVIGQALGGWMYWLTSPILRMHLRLAAKAIKWRSSKGEITGGSNQRRSSCADKVAEDDNAIFGPVRNAVDFFYFGKGHGRKGC